MRGDRDHRDMRWDRDRRDDWRKAMRRRLWSLRPRMAMLRLRSSTAPVSPSDLLSANRSSDAQSRGSPSRVVLRQEHPRSLPPQARRRCLDIGWGDETWAIHAWMPRCVAGALPGPPPCTRSAWRITARPARRNEGSGGRPSSRSSAAPVRHPPGWDAMAAGEMPQRAGIRRGVLQRNPRADALMREGEALGPASRCARASARRASRPRLCATSGLRFEDQAEEFEDRIGEHQVANGARQEMRIERMPPAAG